MLQRVSPRTGLIATITMSLAIILSLIIAPGTAKAANYTTPLTAAFYYPWFPQTWHSNDHYLPSLGKYSSDNPAVIDSHIDSMKYGTANVAIASWWGIGQQSEQTRFPLLYTRSALKNFGIIPYYEPEGYGDVPISKIQSDLAYLNNYVNTYPGSAVKIGGKPAIHVYNAGSTGCGEVTKWKQATANFTTWYVNMKVFEGYRNCVDQPSGWHQYGPAVAESVHLPYSFAISAGFWHHNESTPRLTRDLARWTQNVSRMKASGAQWKYFYFNEWGEGTATESSTSWPSASGHGKYLDILAGSPTTPTTPTTPPTSPTTPPTSPTTTPPPPTGPTITVMAAGDIVGQGSTGYGSSSNQDGFTAELLTKYGPNAILTLGDNQYEQGSLSQYNAGWGRTTCAGVGNCDAWGLHKNNVFPAPGNHEWGTANAQGYRDYFGSRIAAIKAGPGAGEPNSGSQMYYSYDLGAWHFISLDSDCSNVGGCNAGNPQMVWLLADLAANNGKPTIVYYHHPTWSSGQHGSSGGHTYLKSILVGDQDVQIVLSGHDHNYERFAPMGTSGPDPNGVRYFTVGTGGKNPYAVGTPLPGSQVSSSGTAGLLKLVLSATGYSWQFHPISEVGGSGNFTDSGSALLRGSPSPAPIPTTTTTPPIPSPTPTSC